MHGSTMAWSGFAKTFATACRSGNKWLRTERRWIRVQNGRCATTWRAMTYGKSSAEQHQKRELGSWTASLRCARMRGEPRCCHPMVHVSKTCPSMLAARPTQLFRPTTASTVSIRSSRVCAGVRCMHGYMQHQTCQNNHMLRITCNINTHALVKHARI